MTYRDADVKLCAAVAATLQRHSSKYGLAEATDNAVIINTADGGTVSLVVTRMNLSGQEMVEVDADTFDSLREDSRRLRALEAAGVDNWSGHEHAMSIYHGGGE